MQSEFDARNVKIIGLSVDPVEDHKAWLKDIADVTGHSPDYPIIADTDLSVAKLYNMLPREAGTSHAGRSVVENQAVRSVFIVGTDK